MEKIKELKANYLSENPQGICLYDSPAQKFASGLWKQDPELSFAERAKVRRDAYEKKEHFHESAESDGVMPMLDHGGNQTPPKLGAELQQ